ncbi:MAG: hypothetical protein JO024_08350 [Candidatus Eremiobacteraeota bacterium]|nr:hypothetical protein [Candidatus Eremiobacteraeota bacterium]MBV9737029.1 hypothetical protein [Candidatus Eremiobacteraeota bacterium]
MPAAVALNSHRAAFAELKAGLEARHRATLAARFAQADPTLFHTGFKALDSALGGGLARGTIAVFEGEGSSGRTAVAARLLAAQTQSGLAAAIDDGGLYPPGLAAAGVRLERLLVMPVSDPLGAVRAADILMRSHAFGITLMPVVAVKAALWARLASLTHHAGALLLALGDQATNELGYFSSARVRFQIANVHWTDRFGPFAQLAGYEIHAEVIKNKRAAPGTGADIAVGAA